MKEVLLFLFHNIMKQVCRNRRELITGHTEARVTGCMDKSESRPQLISGILGHWKEEEQWLSLSLGILAPPSTPQMWDYFDPRGCREIPIPGWQHQCVDYEFMGQSFGSPRQVTAKFLGFTLWVLFSCMKSGPSLWLPWFPWELYFLFLHKIRGLLKSQSSVSVWKSRLLSVGYGAIYLEVSIPYEV